MRETAIKQHAREHLERSAEVKHRIIAKCLDPIVDAANALAQTLKSGNKIMFCGNGGSAADSQHLAAELTNRMNPAIKRPGLAALALTTDTSFLTSNANDFGFTHVFERQIEALGRPGDALVLLTTSGKSANIIAAAAAARARQIKVIGLLGRDGGDMMDKVDIAIVVPHDSTPHIQEGHIAIGHILCEVAEDLLYGA